MSDFWEWFMGVVTATGVIATGGYVLRDTLAKFFLKSIEHRFDRRLEAFKGELRDNEKELEHIRSFLIAARRDHDAALQAKRLEAAEILIRARNKLAQFSALAEYMTALNTDEILKNHNNPKIKQFIETLTSPFNIREEIKNFHSIDMTLPRLYISEYSLKLFDAYKMIILKSALMMEIFMIPGTDKDKLIKEENLSEIVIDLVPASKDGFVRFGETYAYHWPKYFYDEILKSLRHELSGVGDLATTTKSVENIALHSRRAQVSVQAALRDNGLPTDLMNADVAGASSTAAATSVPN